MSILRCVSNDALWPIVGPVVRQLAPVRQNGRTLLKRVGLFLPMYLVFLAVNIAHGSIRGVGDDVAPFNPVNVAEFDIVLFGTVPSVLLQDWLGTTGFWSDLAFFYWTTLFWVPLLLIAVVVLARGRSYFLRLLLLHMVLVLSADVIYGIVPTRPPWMDVEVVRFVAVRAEDGVYLDGNPFAALPSLHVAVPFIYALWFYGFERGSALRRFGPVLALWALGMSWCVMYSGEHYFIDVVTGYIWALGVFAVLNRFGILHPRVRATEPRSQPVSLPQRHERAA
jgi:membrane-associated phospholipid phosphatase